MLRYFEAISGGAPGPRADEAQAEAVAGPILSEGERVTDQD